MTTLPSFRMHDGTMASPERHAEARNAVADWYITNADAVRSEDAYASHVSERMKARLYHKALAHAEEVREGTARGFTTWQRINYHLTGVSVPLLPQG